MVRNWIKSWIVFMAIALISAGTLYGQNRSSSPYSMYGIGLINNTFSAKSGAMGGLAYGLREDASVNFANPASYTALLPQSFTFSAGILSSKGTLSSLSGSENVSYASINYLAFGFQASKGWNTSLGLIPISNVEYNFASIEENPLVGNVIFTNIGSGGINELFWGNAFKIGDHFSVGINAGFLFGTINKERQLLFVDTTSYLHTSILETILVNDFNLSYGVQYHNKLKNGILLNIGAVYSRKASINAKKDYFVRSFSQTPVGVDFIRETIVNDSAIEGQLTFPSTFGAGFIFEKKDKWKAGLDFEVENWSDYRDFGKSDSLNNSFRVSIGGEYIPNKNDAYSYFKRVAYQFGLKYEKSNLSLRNNQINEYGISFGVSLPMKRSRSTFNIAFEIGQRGTTVNNLIKEKYFRFRLGISLHQIWFIQRKYN